MTTTHPHVATPYELQAAAERRLKAIAFPLTGGWVEGDPRGCPDKGLECGFKKGDRLYLAEKWCKVPWGNEEGKITGEIFFTESKVPEAEHYGWQPASTMPLEAAEHWFLIAGVRVVQMQALTELEVERIMGLEPYSSGSNGYGIFQDSWNAAYPEQPWQGDRWVVVLDVEAMNAPLSIPKIDRGIEKSYTRYSCAAP